MSGAGPSLPPPPDGAAKTLFYPTQGGEPVLKFKVAGQTLLDPVVLSGPEELVTEADWGQFHAKVGAALGAKSSQVPFYSIVFQWQSVATLQRAATKLDAQLDGVSLVVLDASRWNPICCPNCAGKLTGSGFTTSATSAKGLGDCHAVFYSSVNRKCASECKGWPC
jgi:hypothetical protein